ncbi:MAG: glycosyltransferase family 39 protein [Acidobacteria bacterium]|nr:glycosyltransferase family 39 protein [Acidobacteriota bacterium]
MTKPESAIRSPKSAIIAILAVFTYFFGLWLPFFGPDEPRYAQVAREMFERGDWVTPTLGGFHWFEKPALLYWTQIASFNVFGVSEFAARIGPALFGLATVAALWFIGKSVVQGNSIFAQRLAVIAASTLGILVFSRGASFDITITFPVTAAMVCYFIFEGRSDEKGSTVPLVLFYVFVGVAVIAKGLIGIVFPYAIIAFYHVLRRRVPTNRLIVSLFWGTALAVIVAATWYLPMYWRHGWEFIDEFFVQHHFQRYTSNKYQHPQPFYFYLWVLPLMTLPWTPFLLASIWKNAKAAIQRLRVHSERDSSPIAQLTTFAFAWMLVPLVFFSFSGSKLPGYILPAVPPAIILASLYLHELAGKSRRWATAIPALASAVFLVAIMLLLSAVPRFADADSVSGLMRSAQERGYTGVPVYGLHTVVHSAEFYAAGHLLREPDGKQKRLYSPAEVEAEMRRAGAARCLVLVPPEYLKQLTESPIVRSEVIRNNGEWVIVGVSLN